MIFESMADYLREKQYNKSYGDDIESPIKDKPNPFKIDIPGIIDSKITNVLMKVLPSSVGMLAASLAPVLSGTLLTTIYKIYKKDKSLDILKSLKKNYETFSQGKHPVEELLKKYHSPLFTLLKVLYSGGQTWLSILDKFKNTALKALIGTLDTAEELVGHVRYRILPHFVEDEENFFKSLASGIIGPLAIFLEPLKGVVGLVLKIIGKPTLFLFRRLLKNPWDWIKSKLPFGRSKSWIDVILNQVTKSGLKGLFTPKFIKSLMGSLGLGVFWYPLKPYLNLVLKRATYYFEVAKNFLVKLYEKITQLIDVLLGKADIGKTGFTEEATRAESEPTTKPETKEVKSNPKSDETKLPWYSKLFQAIDNYGKEIKAFILELYEKLKIQVDKWLGKSKDNQDESKAGVTQTESKSKSSTSKSKTEEPSWARSLLSNFSKYFSKTTIFAKVSGVKSYVRDKVSKGKSLAAGAIRFGKSIFSIVKNVFKIVGTVVKLFAKILPIILRFVFSKPGLTIIAIILVGLLVRWLWKYIGPPIKDAWNFLKGVFTDIRDTLNEILDHLPFHWKNKDAPTPPKDLALPYGFTTFPPSVQESILKDYFHAHKIPLPENLDSLSQYKRLQVLEDRLDKVQHPEKDIPAPKGKDENQKPAGSTKAEGKPKPTTPEATSKLPTWFPYLSEKDQIKWKNLIHDGIDNPVEYFLTSTIEEAKRKQTEAKSKPKATSNNQSTLKTALDTVRDFISPQAYAAEINLSAIPKNIKPTLSFNSAVIPTDIKPPQQQKPIYVPLSVPVSGGHGAFIPEPVLV
jgi:hypothetical protein